MTLRLALLGLITAALYAAEPVRSFWIMSPPGGTATARILPDVHAVEVTENAVTVRSAGISLRFLGPLEASPLPSEKVHEFVFRFPRHPAPETGTHARIPPDVAGAFLNGVPVYNQFEAQSFNTANLWHYDPMVRASGTGLLEQLAEATGRHSPIIGFALDGYPIYGPWAFANPDATGGVRRMRSGYRLRKTSTRHDWPDGTALTPEQYGPDVTPDAPLGTFAEDYEFAPDPGDLDEFNGRFAVTPEYPAGTYAYYLAGSFPYVIGPRFYGRLTGGAPEQFKPISAKRLRVSANGPLTAGEPVRFRLEALGAHGQPIRFLEYVHERPIHLLVASADLAEFDHIHPELATGDVYEVTHTFAHGGRYRMWADFSLPGEAPSIEWFDVAVRGARRVPQKLTPSSLKSVEAGLGVELVPEKPLFSGEDIPITLRLEGSTSDLQPWLGAWAHVIVISHDLRSFAHAHPLDAVPGVHTHALPGPAPDSIHIVTNFESPGLYKLWAQFQKAGQLVTVPFVLRVAAPQSRPATSTSRLPPGVVRVRVTPHGFEPAIVNIPANAPVTLAFIRDTAPNCGSEVVFPALGISRKLPVGQTTLVLLPAQRGGEMAFSCGTGMFRGSVIAR